MSLEHEIRRVINMESQENGSNTPDHILAAYVTACLDAFNQGVRRRDAWYGVSLSPGQPVEPLRRYRAISDSPQA